MKSTYAVLNVKELLTRVENDRELLLELVMIFKEKLPAQLESLQKAIQAENMDVVANAGHSFKGMLSNLAASRAATAAEHLEGLGRKGDKEEVNEAFIALQEEISLLLPELESCAAEMST
jgi:HPt (histidine-containing phosphotransfer) domain-containing protein